ncbi:TMEM165/GDT1 family protein [Azonexus sp.]|uniref:TMEM165/GDT1 family protein n=1 Tax=Azonexus sp. TaxID=1872668 RepID=UPI0039E6B68F
MDAFLIATGVVALAEVGDKTQLLAFMLAARFKKPLPIIAGILFATLVNHALAGALGNWLISLAGPQTLRWVLGISFIAMALWLLIPDKLDEDDTRIAPYGVFLTTLLAFFLAEMGDKTQIATVALAARFPDFIAVVAGTTLGMLLANVPAVLFGEKISRRLPTRWIHALAALIFCALGIATLLGAGDALSLASPLPGNP